MVHILLVDDDEMLVELGKAILMTGGYKVNAFSCSLEALDRFAQNPKDFDLVITDQTMPGMSGLRLIEEIHKIKPDLPTILCTGFSKKIDEASADKLAGITFLMKPLEAKSLLSKVRAVLDAE